MVMNDATEDQAAGTLSFGRPSRETGPAVADIDEKNGRDQGARQAIAGDMLARALAQEAVAQGQDCARDANGNLACPAVEKTFRWLLEQGPSAKDMPQFQPNLRSRYRNSPCHPRGVISR